MTGNGNAPPREERPRRGAEGEWEVAPESSRFRAARPTERHTLLLAAPEKPGAGKVRSVVLGKHDRDCGLTFVAGADRHDRESACGAPGCCRGGPCGRRAPARTFSRGRGWRRGARSGAPSRGRPTTARARPGSRGSHREGRPGGVQTVRVTATGMLKPASRAVSETSTRKPSSIAWAREYVEIAGPNAVVSPGSALVMVDSFPTLDADDCLSSP